MDNHLDILIVEDSTVQAEILRRLLESHGYRVTIAGNGKEALSLLRHVRPRLIISDIVMPVMDGYELTRELRQDQALTTIPILLLTTLSAPDDIIRGLEARADGYLTKPYDPDYLLSKIRSTLEAPRDARERTDFQEFQITVTGTDGRMEVDPRRLFDLVFSAYENAVHSTNRAMKTQAELLALNQNLEQVVRERTEHLTAEIARRKDAEHTLVEHAERLRSVMESAPDPIIGADSGGKIITWNSAATRAFGYTDEEALGQSVTLVIPDRFEALHERAMARAVAPGRPYDDKRVNEVAGRRKDGTEFPLESSVSSWKTPEGTFFTVILRDLTERKKAEEELRLVSEDIRKRNQELAALTTGLEKKNEELQLMSRQLWQTAKLATIGELAASIAHELNNPLATVSLRTEGLLAKTASDHPNHRTLGIIGQEVERMGNLVANLLQFSRRYRPEVSTVRLDEEIDKTMELIQGHFRNHRITVARDCDRDLPMIRVDRQQLRQLFLNLFTNASDAMPEGGTLTVRTAMAETPPEHVLIQVIDTGIGIAEKDLARVTEPFFTTKPEGKGTGLGLPICRRIVQEHGGTLEITSEPAKGTTVSIVLPCAAAPNAAYLRGEGT